MQGYTAKNILEGLKDKDTRVLDYIYENYFYQVKVFITRNHGTVEDARDIYQDALLVIYQKSRQNNLALSCSFNTYLYSVCRLLWLKQLEQKKLERMTTEDTGMFVELDDSIISLSEANERYKLYQEHFRRLSFSCQKVMELFLAGITLKEIARILGFKSEQYAKKRKHQCKEKLVNSIKSDFRFRQIEKQLHLTNT